MISVVILAAGESKRMGQPKMLLRWGNLTVIEHVINTFLKAGLEDIVVVIGGAYEQVEKAINQYPIRKIHNKDYATGEMLSSLQCGIRALSDQAQAVLIGLGDQPQIREESIRAICDVYKASTDTLIVPSFQMKRGHPWLVARPLWDDLLSVLPPKTPRDFLNDHSDQIHYANLDTLTILSDLDTPEDYQNIHP
jgi:molybdenum cofactor cytidylyltransferase